MLVYFFLNAKNVFKSSLNVNSIYKSDKLREWIQNPNLISLLSDISLSKLLADCVKFK